MENSDFPKTYSSYKDAPLNRWVVIANSEEGLFCYRHDDGITFAHEVPEGGKPPHDQSFYFEEEIPVLAAFLSASSEEGGLAR